MIVVETHEYYRLEWLDEERTILCVVIEPEWTWAVAEMAIKALDREIASVTHDIYSVYLFQPDAGKLPKFSAPNIRRILGNEMPNERLAILVGADGYITSLLSMLQRVYGYLASNASKVRIVNTLDEALKIIEADKAEAISQG